MHRASVSLNACIYMVVGLGTRVAKFSEIFANALNESPKETC